MNLMVTSEAQKYILLNGGNALANLRHPRIQLGCPDETKADVNTYKEVLLNGQVRVYIHLSLLNLDDSYNLKIDTGWGLFGKKLVLRGL
ncbi:hypothetical protein [Desulfitobacterium metallireducens]|uniref:Uncharacterized protein n=1 Tax=Desulfitobacterium metallireducens DSM 15288 TaxID=871968 RepID=W0EI31_9FIRM|nr:hypothetical protein [Desulfitobacterium metallireducens]AHF08711.1 hypothetical protein DESME_15635 [Desulfitobacterium metallireducens DSM 15288]